MKCEWIAKSCHVHALWKLGQVFLHIPVLLEPSDIPLLALDDGILTMATGIFDGVLHGLRIYLITDTYSGLGTMTKAESESALNRSEAVEIGGDHAELGWYGACGLQPMWFSSFHRKGRHVMHLKEVQVGEDDYFQNVGIKLKQDSFSYENVHEGRYQNKEKRGVTVLENTKPTGVVQPDSPASNRFVFRPFHPSSLDAHDAIVQSRVYSKAHEVPQDLQLEDTVTDQTNIASSCEAVRRASSERKPIRTFLHGQGPAESQFVMKEKVDENGNIAGYGYSNDIVDTIRD